MKKIIFILLLIFSKQLFCYQNTKESHFVFADLLYWQVGESGSENWAQSITPAGTQQSAQIEDVSFDWNTGVRFGVGYNSLKNWDAVIYFTGFHTQALKNITGEVYSAFLGNFFANNTTGSSLTSSPHYRNANIKWKVALDELDIELGHVFQINSALKLKPFVGIKTARINQSIYSNWNSPINVADFTAASENLKNDFWGIGPSIGLNTTWNIAHATKNSLNIIGNFSGAILSGHWNFKDHYTNDLPTSITINTSHIGSAATMATALLGVEWQRHCAQMDITARLGYEMQIWFNQLQFYSYNMGKLNNLMSFQGGILGLSINF